MPQFFPFKLIFRTKAFGCTLLYAAISPWLAQADEIVINVSGTVVTSNIAAVPVGTAYTAQAVYDTSPSASGVDGLGGSLYTFTNPQDGLTVDIGGYEETTVGAPLGSQLTVALNESAYIDGVLTYVDLYNFRQSNYSQNPTTGSIGGLPAGDIELDLFGSPGFLSSTSVSTSLNLSDLIPTSSSAAALLSLQTALYLSQEVGGSIVASVDSVQVTDESAVPEPATADLSVLALVFIGFSTWRLDQLRRSPMRAFGLRRGTICVWAGSRKRFSSPKINA